MRKVYPVGYSMSGSIEYVETLMAQTNTLLIDTRYRLRSWLIDWREDALRAKYGERYRWAGQFLGNVNFQGGPIKLANPVAGLRGLCMYLDKGYDLVLLCQCSAYDACHRKLIVDLLLQRVAVEVVQPDPVKQESESIMCLSIRPPYSHWLANPGLFINAGIQPKRIENRDWTTRYRGPLLLHASNTFEKDALGYWAMRCPELAKIVPLEESGYTKGAIVGVADLVDVVSQSKDPWFVGKYGFVLAHARPLEPIPHRGQLKLFPVPVSLLPLEVDALVASL